MSQGLPADEPPIHDLIGVGFGPSNLALAIAVAEHNAASPDQAVTAHFLERQPHFGWHRGMLIDDATMQVSFLKDLVTLRNPASRFTFLSYLKERGRLVDFINAKSLFPLRVEFHDYFEWCAARLEGDVSYGHEVVEVRPVETDGQIRHYDVLSRGADGTPAVHRARNLVLATGLRPRLPEGMATGERIWHNSQLLHRVGSIDTAEARRFVVVGAGQSAAEVTAYLHERFRSAEVCAVFSRFGISPSDDSPLANRVFDPSAVDDYFGAPEDVKRMIMGYHANTNYSVADLDLIEDLYRRTYQEKVLGVERLRWFNTSRAVEADDTGSGVRVVVESMTTGKRTDLDADVLVYATGYRPSDPLALLGTGAERFHTDDQGRPMVERDFRVTSDAAVRAGVYLQGGATEHTHGITSSLLSNNAVRSGEILDSILQRRPEDVPRSAVAEPAAV
ncbi:L-ornithine N5-oxygenase [Nocardiopsis sp. Huas11]|uniref:lysine N(6)-hydroxylase/L-ornithine N(5)-oxygenase family protein n=1 Tax=Nocardiopsis sp. Huas11 TaxID=2183912 RepID=UPI000EADFF57|nr:lysine N(6)-hydroxylase/L-ornithine N(5)-oxygenase family protein [Nocardiopsis sp. Huas11]RKS05939.1 L-ornithine N5-oxygenase [Nocardiopsis sp. Huas11]